MMEKHQRFLNLVPRISTQTTSSAGQVKAKHRTLMDEFVLITDFWLPSADKLEMMHMKVQSR